MLFYTYRAVVVFSDILDILRSTNLFILEKKQQITLSFCTFGTFCEDNNTLILILHWKLCIAVLTLWSIKNSERTDHHICPNPKLMSGSTGKSLARVAYSLHAAFSQPDVQTGTSAERQYIPSGLAVSSTRR